MHPNSQRPNGGRFAIRDHGKLVGVGVIKEVTKRPLGRQGID